jgi:hypothetical protein
MWSVETLKIENSSLPLTAISPTNEQARPRAVVSPHPRSVPVRIVPWRTLPFSFQVAAIYESIK